MNTKSPYKRVALIIETSNEYARGLLHGIRHYVNKNQNWILSLWEHDRSSTDISWLSNWHGDGIIARIENEKIASYIQKSGLPAVDLSAGRLLPRLSCFETNDTAIAHLAFNHLIEKGYRHFAFCGDSQFLWSQQRQSCFEKSVIAAGHSFSCFDSAQFRTNTKNGDWYELVDWLKKLPKPCGIMACYDIQGRHLLEACRFEYIPVPEDIGVIGVDNDILLCELSHPNLTSIRPNTIKTGYEAANFLDNIMSGLSYEPKVNSIDPLEIIERQSTELVVHDDKYLALSLKFIRENSHLAINVQDILDMMPISRRVLENLYRKKIGRTPHEVIIDTKIRKAKQLLIETQLTISQIAEKTGFVNADYFSVVFKKIASITPSEFRKEITKNYKSN